MSISSRLCEAPFWIVIFPCTSRCVGTPELNNSLPLPPFRLFVCFLNKSFPCACHVIRQGANCLPHLSKDRLEKKSLITRHKLWFLNYFTMISSWFPWLIIRSLSWTLHYDFGTIWPMEPAWPLKHMAEAKSFCRRSSRGCPSSTLKLARTVMLVPTLCWLKGDDNLWHVGVQLFNCAT